MITITKYTHPALFKSLRLIDADCGLVDPAPIVSYTLRTTEYEVGRTNNALATLSEDELYTMSCGTAQDIADIIFSSRDLVFANEFLAEYLTGVLDL